MKKIFFTFAILTAFLTSVCAYSKTIQSDLENSLIRLHIIAQSDSEFDQNMKLKVRDAVLLKTADTDISDTDNFLRIAEDAANKCLRENGVDYRAAAQFGVFHFPEKSYKNITLPAGDYRGVRIILGDGGGKNWWCVMYPPLCVESKTEKAQMTLKAALRPDTYEVITQKPQVRFKILELLSND